MPRDYKSRALPASSNAHQSPAWVWFVSGLLAGFFIAGLAWLKLAPSDSPASPRPATASPADSARQITDPKPKNSTPPPPRFDFYTLLPEMEVIIPEEELKEPEPPRERPRVKDQPPSPEKTKAPKETYVLQMGSFRKLADADRMKARLALLDIRAKIEKVTVNNKDTFHRVRSGPYDRRDRVNDLRTRLKRNRINNIVIKLKQ